MLSVKIISLIIIGHACGVVDCMFTVFFAASEEVAAQVPKTDNINFLGAPVEKI